MYDPEILANILKTIIQMSSAPSEYDMDSIKETAQIGLKAAGAVYEADKILEKYK